MAGTERPVEIACAFWYNAVAFARERVRMDLGYAARVALPAVWPLRELEHADRCQ